MPLLTPLVIALSFAVGSSPSPAPTEGAWPLTPTHQVVRSFDPPASPWGAGHRGVDLLGTAGEPVHAALAGTVTFAGELAGRGVVVVDHGGRRTTYEPVAASVAVGARVAAGAVLGHLQAAMSHCFPRTCLHWGLLSGDTYLDPLTLVGGGPVRLLPLDGDPTPSAAYAPARSVLSGSASLPARRSGAVRNRPLGVPFAPLALVLRPAGGPAGTPPAAARW